MEDKTVDGTQSSYTEIHWPSFSAAGMTLVHRKRIHTHVVSLSTSKDALIVFSADTCKCFLPISCRIDRLSGRVSE
jgi:hypothetical protein